jgi:hypothetical protein
MLRGISLRSRYRKAASVADMVEAATCLFMTDTCNFLQKGVHGDSNHK